MSLNDATHFSSIRISEETALVPAATTATAAETAAKESRKAIWENAFTRLAASFDMQYPHPVRPVQTRACVVLEDSADNFEEFSGFAPRIRLEIDRYFFEDL